MASPLTGLESRSAWELGSNKSSTGPTGGFRSLCGPRCCADSQPLGNLFDFAKELGRASSSAGPTGGRGSCERPSTCPSGWRPWAFPKASATSATGPARLASTTPGSTALGGGGGSACSRGSPRTPLAWTTSVAAAWDTASASLCFSRASSSAFALSHLARRRSSRRNSVRASLTVLPSGEPRLANSLFSQLGSLLLRLPFP